jgi:putative DNA primase/helicase
MVELIEMKFGKDTHTVSRKTWALKYAKRGWPVLPLHTAKDGQCSCGNSCDRPGKHPRTTHGVKDATTNRRQTRVWWKKWPDSNIGIATGRQVGILVLDIDPRNGGLDTLQNLKAELGSLPDTATANTGGGGQHLFFRHPTFPVRKDNAGKLLGPGVDVLSDGCYVVAPPSRHGSGRRYAWADGKSPSDVEVAKLPKVWRDRLRGTTADAQPPATPEREADGLIREGERNNYLTRQAGAMQRSGMSADAIVAGLLAENGAKCTPPLDKSEVKQIAKSIRKYTALNEGTDAAEALMHVVLDRRFDGGKHLLLGADHRFWHYDGRLWRPVPEEWVSGRVLESIQHNPVKNQRTAALLSQVLALLKAKLAVASDLLSFVASPPPVINCANGELWIADDGSVELRTHSPASHLRHCLDVAYDPDAKCREYDRTVLEIFGKADKPEAMVRHWNELMGYIIQPSRNIPIVAILYGRGDNGKTKLVRTITRLLGPDLVYSQRVDELEKNRFTMGALFGKYLLVDDDVRAGARLPDGILKTISEAKEATGELKFGPSFSFVVRTVPVLLCNNVPSLADLSHGMQRRLMVIPFDRTFTDQDRDRSLFDRIWANELSGVLNRALEGYRRIVQRESNLKRPSAVQSATSHWLTQANPLPAFIQQQCNPVPGNGCTMQDFYAAYSSWTRSMGYTLTQTQQVVDRNLTHLGYATKKSNKGKVVVGLALGKTVPSI